MAEVYNFSGQVIGYDPDDDAPESNDSDGDLIPPMDGDDDGDQEEEQRED